MKKIITLVLSLALLFTITVPAFANSVEVDPNIPMIDAQELKDEWKVDQNFELADPAPWNLQELKQVVDVQDPRSVAAYFVWAVMRLTDNYDQGMEMMKYLYADLEPYGRGFTEGGLNGKAGWNTYFNERIKGSEYNWLPRAYFNGADSRNGFKPNRPLELELYYNKTNTETLNAQTLESLGRLNIIYWVQSYAAGNKVNITVSKFDGSDRWYVTSSTSSSTLFYNQSSALTADAKKLMETLKNDDSTEAEHQARYGGSTEQGNTSNLPFTDVPQDSYYAEPVAWAYTNDVTTGTSETTFGPLNECTRGQVVTFLWRAAGKPEPENTNNPFSDVKETDYFYKPILWAVENGITAGVSPDRFAPKNTCSSAHIITFLYRALKIGNDGWSGEAKQWAEDNQLLDETGIKVSPEEMCPRGAVVTFLFRTYN